MARNAPANFRDDLLPGLMAEATRPERAMIRSVERGRRARLDGRGNFLVSSDTGHEPYIVRIVEARDGVPVSFACSCPDGTYRPGEGGCHHVGSVARRLARAGLTVFSEAHAAYVPTQLAVAIGAALPAHTEAELEDAFAGLPTC